MIDSLPHSDVSEHRYSTALGSSKLLFEFTGTGVDYFKIWIVGVLLTLVTLGLYYPWAKVRRLRYFYAHTQFDGDALEYDGKPAVLARGYALLAVMAGMGWAASAYAKAGSLAVLLVVTALLPGLLHASLHYRLSHTSWRGLRFGFAGTPYHAYRATSPLSGACGVVMALALLSPSYHSPPRWLGYCAIALGVVFLGLTPWMVWNFKNYQHRHFTLGTLTSRFKATAPDYYRLFLQIYLFAAIVISIATTLFFDWLHTTAPAAGGSSGAALLPVSATGYVYSAAVALTLWLFVRPFAVSRLQNVAWTQTGNSSMRCVSLLRYRDLMWLGFKNSLLTVLTVGLYWPFAAVTTARLRIESVRVKTRVDPNILVSSARPTAGKSSAQAQKLLGMEMGL